VWKIMYGENSTLSKINSQVSSLNDAAKTILDEDNIDYWLDQESVKAFKTNWTNTQTKYNNGVYLSATQFAKSAEKNAETILQKGFITIENNSQQLLYGVIIGLIILIIAVFVLEKFVLNKEKKEIEYEEEDEDF
jgi:hypothetical protein